MMTLVGWLSLSLARSCQRHANLSGVGAGHLFLRSRRNLRAHVTDTVHIIEDFRERLRQVWQAPDILGT
jgi:hypothetical protein